MQLAGASDYHSRDQVFSHEAQCNGARSVNFGRVPDIPLQSWLSVNSQYEASLIALGDHAGEPDEVAVKIATAPILPQLV